MAGEMTPDDRYGPDTLRAIRQRVGVTAGAVLRPEELAMLKDWRKSCGDPERRRQLDDIIRAFG